LRDRVGEQVEVVGGGVRAGVARPQLDRQHLAGVVAGHEHGVEAVRVFVGGCRAVLVRVGEHDGGVDVQHHRSLADLAAGRRRRRRATAQLPQPGPHHRPGGGDAPQPHPIELVEHSPDRGVRGDRPEHLLLVAQHVDVADRLTAVGDQHREIDQQPAAVMGRPPAPAGQCRRQRRGQPGPVGQQPQQRRADMRHHL
jgi:hypothetical protein